MKFVFTESKELTSLIVFAKQDEFKSQFITYEAAASEERKSLERNGSEL